MGKRWQRCYLLIPVYPSIRIFPCKMSWWLLKLQRNFPREYHTVIPVYLWIKIWSNDECALIVPYIFCPLKGNHFTGLVAESLKITLKTQQSVCDHCELLPFSKGSYYVWWYFKRWSGPWSTKLMQKILISRILLMIKMKVNSVVQSLILMKSLQPP